KLKNVFAVTMIGYFANAAIPRLGEVLKCAFLARYEHLKVDKLVGTIIIERAFDIVCYILFIGLTILIEINVVGNYLKNKFLILTASTGMPIWAKILIGILVLIAILYFIKFLLRTFPHNKIIFKVTNFLKGIIIGFKSIKHLTHKRSFILHTIFIWTMYLLQIYVGFYAMEGISGLGFKA